MQFQVLCVLRALYRHTEFRRIVREKRGKNTKEIYRLVLVENEVYI